MVSAGKNHFSEESFQLFFDGEKSGPFLKEEIIVKYNSGEITLDAMIRKTGSKSAWIALAEAEWILSVSGPEGGKESVDEMQEHAAPFAASGPETLVVCPHCWHKFPVSKTLFIAKHTDLVGDPILGADAQMRFLPTAFNRQGYAVDARGLVCQDMACPNCHLRIPEAVMDVPSCSFSIVGAPASGKSYYLTAMIWQLRNILAEKFDYTLADTDAVFNSVLNHYEQILFLNRRRDEYVSLPKTQQQGNDFSNQIMLNGMSVDLPLPFIFTLTPLPSNSNYGDARSGMRNIILYDNAGEHFEPGRDHVTNLATRHLMHSDSIVFLYDPIKDSRMVSYCDPSDPQVAQVNRGSNQLVLLNEMIARIKKYAGLGSREKYRKPLIVVIPKYDAWKSAFPLDLEQTRYTYYSEEDMSYFLDIGAITNVSYVMRDELLRISPEVVATCEAFSSRVYFLPGSALGRIPEYDTGKDMIVVKPQSLKPVWAEVPMLLQFWLSGLLPGIAAEPADFLPIEKYRFVEGSLIYALPGTRDRRTVPGHYLGRVVYSSALGCHVRFPDPEEVSAGRSPREGGGVAEDDFWTKE